MSPEQKQFDTDYITSAEITSFVGVSKPSITRAVDDGRLPYPIRVGAQGAMVWRREVVGPLLKDWRESVRRKKGLPA